MSLLDLPTELIQLVINYVHDDDLFFFVSTCSLITDIFYSMNRKLKTSASACFLSLSRTIWMGRNLRGEGYGKGYGRKGRTKGYSFHPFLFREASSRGKVEVLEWLISKHCPFDSSALAAAFLNKHLEASLYLTRFITPDDKCWAALGKNGDMNFFKQFEEWFKIYFSLNCSIINPLIRGVADSDHVEFFCYILSKFPNSYDIQIKSRFVKFIERVILLNSNRIAEFFIVTYKPAMNDIIKVIELCIDNNKESIFCLIVDTYQISGDLITSEMFVHIVDMFSRTTLDKVIALGFRTVDYEILEALFYKGYLDLVDTIWYDSINLKIKYYTKFLDECDPYRMNSSDIIKIYNSIKRLCTTVGNLDTITSTQKCISLLAHLKDDDHLIGWTVDNDFSYDKDRLIICCIFGYDPVDKLAKLYRSNRATADEILFLIDTIEEPY